MRHSWLTQFGVFSLSQPVVQYLYVHSHRSTHFTQALQCLSFAMPLITPTPEVTSLLYWMLLDFVLDQVLVLICHWIV